jgi:GNAT superfamily N-acetyltransferase
MELGAAGTRLDEVAALIRAAFATNKEGGLDYTTEFVASCFEYPGTDRELSPAFFEGERMVSFLGSFPRRVRIAGRPCSLALLTFDSVDPDSRGHGLGSKMFAEAVHRARKNNFDGVIFYCVEGHIANRISVAGVEAAGVPCRQVFALDYLMALPKPAQTMPGSVVPDVDTFLQASEPLARLPFARLWQREEAEWELFKRCGAVSYAMKSGPNTGLISGYIICDNRGTRCAQIENVLVDGLDPAQKSLALTGFLAEVSGKAQVVLAPAWNYVEESVFRAAGFRRTSRRLNVYLSLWNGQELPDSFDSMYIDVL